MEGFRNEGDEELHKLNLRIINFSVKMPWVICLYFYLFIHRSRYTVYQKTVPDLPPPSKRRKTASPTRHIHDDEDDENEASNSVVTCVSTSDVSQSSTTGASSMICSKHWVHIFNDKDDTVECFLTEQLLGIRAQLKDKFPGCDIYKPKKPKGI